MCIAFFVTYIEQLCIFVKMCILDMFYCVYNSILFQACKPVRAVIVLCDFRMLRECDDFLNSCAGSTGCLHRITFTSNAVAVI